MDLVTIAQDFELENFSENVQEFIYKELTNIGRGDTNHQIGTPWAY